MHRLLLAMSFRYLPLLVNTVYASSASLVNSGFKEP